MEHRILKLGDKQEITVKIFAFFDRAGFLGRKEEFIKKVAQDISEIKGQSFAGFDNEKDFMENLDYWLPDLNRETSYPSERISLEEISRLIIEALSKVKDLLKVKEFSLYLFPTTSNFVVNQMGGVSGRFISGGVIYIDIFPKTGWQRNFKGTLLHEVAHSLTKGYSYDMSIAEGIVFDGIAENFQETFLKEGKNPWVAVLSRDEALKLFEEIRPMIASKDLSLYQEVFFGAGKYPLWAGYAIGYYLVKEYIRRHGANWEDLFSKGADHILKDLNDFKSKN